MLFEITVYTLNGTLAHVDSLRVFLVEANNVVPLVHGQEREVKCKTARVQYKELHFFFLQKARYSRNAMNLSIISYPPMRA
jgi:hypothetical protein